MRIKHLLFLAFAFVTISASAQTKKKTAVASAPAPAATSTALPRPKLVVGIVVDQMRWDYLYRFYDRYQNNGFKRLLNEGFSCENTQVDYIPTFTAPGHTCIYTGSVPAIHGIAGNDFIIQATGKSMYCTEDTTVQTVGSTSKAGQMSPRNLLTTTVTDELKLATNFRSKVIGIALKDRGGILPAGHSADAAYWFDDKTGNWITSTYYMQNLPQWVSDFNDQKLAETYLKVDWNPLYPLDTYLQSTPDNTKYEGKFKGTDAPTLPVKTSAIYKGNLGLIRSTPFGNTLTLDFAVAAINSEELGQHSVTDFLAVSLSSTDYIGHQFGINAVEIEDTYLHLDRDLASFLTYLDAKVGKGNYTVFLTADHGAAHNTAFLNDHGIPAGVWDDGDALKDLNKYLLDKYKVDGLVLSLTNYQVNFNYKTTNYLHLDMDALKKDCISYLQQQPAIAFAVDMKKVQTADLPEALRTRIMNGYSVEHSGEIQIILKPGWFTGHGSGDSGPTGTTHGTWNPYDNHIPLVFMGWGIQHGTIVRETHMTDIAATVAALLHIQAPNGCIGQPISEVLKK
ncbi:putative AlkP superfamily pyrophosphatase or phosphodiesterase [Mucilaginibacter frigoritolerans]|uniref:Putative AlkP superfamily pyrophosphatase or phosphodiesterase n=1 Tax=Mucilaginibacter frigoritolerans TaxID=652788 RepID=A0A562U0L0_9SPHI|nr:alkaline phosphatase PafA [Mucilaginibacter frigoritolerans]TWI99375.1 putative AlkP superfamily pyrophosphatase or phosphodiesterase [Mucilaginibacter frigoritolerans]